MKGLRFSEGQIIAILTEHEAGVATVDLCRKHGVSNATFCKWKAKYGGSEGEPLANEARRLKALEDENAELKTLLAEQTPDNAMPRNVTAKKW